MHQQLIAGTLKAQRALIASSIEAPERFTDLIGAFFHSFWVDKKPVQLPEVFTTILKSTVGVELATRIEQLVSMLVTFYSSLWGSEYVYASRAPPNI